MIKNHKATIGYLLFCIFTCTAPNIQANALGNLMGEQVPSEPSAAAMNEPSFFENLEVIVVIGIIALIDVLVVVWLVRRSRAKRPDSDEAK